MRAALKAAGVPPLTDVLRTSAGITLQKDRTPRPCWCGRNWGPEGPLLEPGPSVLLLRLLKVHDCHSCWNHTAWAETKKPKLRIVASTATSRENWTKVLYVPIAFQPPDSACHWQTLTGTEMTRKSGQCSLQTSSSLHYRREHERVEQRQVRQILDNPQCENVYVLSNRCTCVHV